MFLCCKLCKHILKYIIDDGHYCAETFNRPTMGSSESSDLDFRDCGLHYQFYYNIMYAVTSVL